MPPPQPPPLQVDANTNTIIIIGIVVAVGCLICVPIVVWDRRRQPPNPLGQAEAESNQDHDVFLSHNWGDGHKNHKRVKKINKQLKAAGILTWFDGESMRGDMNKEMAKAIRASKVMVVFITKEYIEKASGQGPKRDEDNCKFEFDTALLESHLGCGKMISAVVMEPGCRDTKKWPGGTVKTKLGLRKYVDMADGHANLGQLVDEIRKLMAA